MHRSLHLIWTSWDFLCVVMGGASQDSPALPLHVISVHESRGSELIMIRTAWEGKNLICIKQIQRYRYTDTHSLSCFVQTVFPPILYYNAWLLAICYYMRVIHNSEKFAWNSRKHVFFGGGGVHNKARDS